MIINTYLHNEIAQTLMCFGDLSDVVNNILKAGADGMFDIMNKPPCPDKTNCEHFRIDVTEPTYIELYKTFGSNNPRISLRRLLYWFVENEIYSELDWTPTNQPTNKRQTLYNKHIEAAIIHLIRAKRYTSKNVTIDNIVKELENEKERSF